MPEIIDSIEAARSEAWDAADGYYDFRLLFETRTEVVVCLGTPYCRVVDGPDFAVPAITVDTSDKELLELEGQLSAASADWIGSVQRFRFSDQALKSEFLSMVDAITEGSFETAADEPQERTDIDIEVPEVPSF